MSSFKMGVCGVFMALCLASPLYAKTSMRDSAEKAMMYLGKDIPDLKYDCQGDEVKASCVAKKVEMKSGLNLHDIRIDYMMNGNEINQAIVFYIQVVDSRIERELEFVPKKISCSSPANLKGKIYSRQISCELNAPAYVLKIKGAGSVESHKFLNKDVLEASDEFNQLVDNIDDLNMQQALKDFKIDAREITIDIKGNRFASKMIDVLKNEDPNYTKEQYDANVNMGIAMALAGLANAKVSESTLKQVTNVATALGDVATSKKRQAILTLKRKDTTMLELTDFADLLERIDMDPSLLLKYLDDYQISVVTH